MQDGPFMPKATAVWLVQNTTLSFKQIANFCNLHELEVKGIADGDVAKGIKAYNPILAGQLTREEIDVCSKDQERYLKINKKNQDVFVTSERKKVKCVNFLEITETEVCSLLKKRVSELRRKIDVNSKIKILD